MRYENKEEIRKAIKEEKRSGHKMVAEPVEESPPEPPARKPLDFPKYKLMQQPATANPSEPTRLPSSAPAPAASSNILNIKYSGKESLKHTGEIAKAEEIKKGRIWPYPPGHPQERLESILESQERIPKKIFGQETLERKELKRLIMGKNVE